MPIKYVGKASDFKGKLLFHILCNLKNFGVGRVVVRNQFLRYPEPTYYRVVKAEPMMDPENKDGKVWVERVFRGVKTDGLWLLSTSWKKDFQLLSKEEEAEYCKPPKEAPIKILPSSCVFPPLLKELVIRDMKAQGIAVREDPRLPLVYRTTPNANYRVAKSDEKPTVQFDKAWTKPKFYVSDLLKTS